MFPQYLSMISYDQNSNEISFNGSENVDGPNFFLIRVKLVDSEDNELITLEMIHLYVEVLDRYFGNVCELDIMFNLEKAHFILDEMVMNGCIIETNKNNILSPVMLLDKTGSL